MSDEPSPEMDHIEPVAGELTTSVPSDQGDRPNNNSHRRFAGSHRWASSRSRWIAGTVVVTVLGLGAAAAALVEFEGGRGRGEDRSGDNGVSCGQGATGEHQGSSDGDHTESCDTNSRTVDAQTVPTTAAPVIGSRSNDPNGPVVIEPSTAGGNRTVVWPDGRVVTIPSLSSASTTSPTTTSAP